MLQTKNLVVLQEKFVYNLSLPYSAKLPAVLKMVIKNKYGVNVLQSRIKQITICWLSCSAIEISKY